MNCTSSPWFDFVQPRKQARLRLICLPFAGGSAALFRQWHRRIDPRIEVWPVQLPGRGSRFREMPLRDMNELAVSLSHELRPLLDMPVAFFGHSMGALAAFATASRLETVEGCIPELVLVSAASPPHLMNRVLDLHKLDDERLVEQLRELKGTPEMILTNRDALSAFLPSIRADLEMAERYSHSPSFPIKAPIHCFAGRYDEMAPDRLMPFWRDLTQGVFSLTQFSGDHFYISSQEDLLLIELSRRLSIESLSRAAERATKLS